MTTTDAPTDETTYDFGHTDVDPDLDDPTTLPAAHSLLDDLRTEVGQKAATPPITLPTPTREGWNVRYRTEDLDSNRIGRWQKACKDTSQPEDIDADRFAATLLANQCEAILRGDVEAHDERGERITFGSDEMRKMMGVGRAVEVVMKWYGSAGHMQRAANAVLQAAGFDPEAMTSVDPTT